MRALIVGGEEKYAMGPMADKLATLGVEVVGHQGGRGRRPSVSGLGDAEVVIALKDTMSHGLWKSAKELAEEAGILFVSTGRKWPAMEADLRRVLQHNGLVPPAEVQEEEETPPHSRYYSPAVTQLAERAEESPMDDQTASVSLKEVTTLILEERPELILQPEELTGRVAEFLDDAAPDALVIKSAVARTSQSLRAQWVQDGMRGGSNSPERLASRKRLQDRKAAWLRRELADAPPQNLPSFRVLEERCRKIFGSTPNREDLRVCRQEARSHRPDPEPAAPEPTAPTSRPVVYIIGEERPASPTRFQAMKKLWDLCRDLGVEMHHEAAQYFESCYGGEPPEADNGVIIRASYKGISEIPVTKIPTAVTHLVFKVRFASPGDGVEEGCDREGQAEAD